jgi:predicted RNA binding protein YcfA (HicA-like mRNA interferase family)
MNITLDTKQYSGYHPSFYGKSSVKFLLKLKETKKIKYIKASYDDIVRAYNELGYDVLQKRGSHAVVVISDKVKLSLVKPHGDKKVVSATDLKKLKYVALGEIERAKAIE